LPVVFELDKRGEFGDRWMVIHTAVSVPVSAESRSPPTKNLPPPASHEPGRSVNPPPGPPHSGWVQHSAGANRRERIQFRFAVHATSRRWLSFWSLGNYAPPCSDDDSVLFQ
jgi:hypothetical protein